MDLIQVIEKRTSVRSFLPDPVPIEAIKKIIRLGGLAPSVNNYQPWSFVLIKNQKKLNQLAEIVNEKYEALPPKDSKFSGNIKNQVEWYSTFFTKAPALIAVVLEKYESVLEKGVDMSHDEINKIRNYPDIQSTGACIQNMLLAAVDLGYGACWLSGPMIAGPEIEKSLEIEAPSRLLSFIAIGKPSKDFRPKEKENLSERLRVYE